MNLSDTPGAPGSDGRDDPLITRLRLLTDLTEPDLVQVARLVGVAQRVNARTELVRQDGRSDHLHVLLDGWACRHRLLRDGRRQITALFLPGDICDLETLYAARGRSTSATLTACLVAKIPRASLAKLAADRTGINAALCRLLVIEQAKLSERILSLGRCSARERLAHLLCELFVRLNMVGRASTTGFDLPITQEEVADVLGLTSVHVNRVLQSLRSDRLIEQRSHHVTIGNFASLQRVAAFLPDYLFLAGPTRSMPAWLGALGDRPTASMGVVHG